MKNNVIKMFVFVILFVVFLTGCTTDDTEKNDEVISSSIGDLKFNMPVVFEKSKESSSDIIFYNFDTSDNKNICLLDFSISDYPEDNLQEVIEDNLLHEDNINYSTKNINGEKWTVGYVKMSEKSISYSYAINYHNKLYQFDFDDYGSGNLCEDYRVMIENSLDFK